MEIFASSRAGPAVRSLDPAAGAHRGAAGSANRKPAGARASVGAATEQYGGHEAGRRRRGRRASPLRARPTRGGGGSVLGRYTGSSSLPACRRRPLHRPLGRPAAAAANIRASGPTAAGAPPAAAAETSAAGSADERPAAPAGLGAGRPEGGRTRTWTVEKAGPTLLRRRRTAHAAGGALRAGEVYRETCAGAARINGPE